MPGFYRCCVMSSSPLEAEVATDVTDSVMDVEEYRRLREVSKHRVFLGVATVVLILAVVLGVEGESRVVLPWLDVPLPELCSMRSTVGIPCPGCGLTRCFVSLMHGDAAAAWHFNPAGLAIFAFVVLQIPYRSYQLLSLARGRTPWQMSAAVSTYLISFLASLLVIQWVARLFIPW